MQGVYDMHPSRAEHDFTYSLLKEYGEYMKRVEKNLEQKYAFNIKNYIHDLTVLC